MVSLCRMVCDVAYALWRWASHSGGLLGVVQSVSLVSLSAWCHALMTTTSRDEEGC